MSTVPVDPLVSVVMPVRNEVAYIRRSLGAVLEQDYPARRMEVIVVDGMSEDGTVDEVRRLVDERGKERVRVIENPELSVPYALNRGIRCAQGDVIVRVDGHCVIANDYVRRCVAVLRETGASCVGGVMTTTGETPVARAIACAQSSRFGVGGVAFRTGRDAAGAVDTVPFGAYTRTTFERVGWFDTHLVRNQDDEFNYRMNRSGLVVWLDPSIRSVYYSRSGLGGLFRQYFGYGLYKVRVLQKHGLVSPRHLVPAGLVLALVSSASVSVARRQPVWLASTLALYGAANLSGSVLSGAPFRRAPIVSAAFAMMHLGYGIGFLAGLWRWRRSFGRSTKGSVRRTS